MNKLIFMFSGTRAARRFVEKVKQLPYVTYATDYVRDGGHANVMVCGEFNPEREEYINSLKRY